MEIRSKIWIYLACKIFGEQKKQTFASHEVNTFYFTKSSNFGKLLMLVLNTLKAIEAEKNRAEPSDQLSGEFFNLVR